MADVTSVSDGARDRFDVILESILEGLPEAIGVLLEEVPLVVDDEPGEAMALSLLVEWGEGVSDEDVREVRETLCGLHSGPMLTERSVELPLEMPEHVVLYRRGIYEAAGGFGASDEALSDEIEITLLHEIGHHFGLGEDDLERLGYA